MKDIKYFIYKDTKHFSAFLKDRGYSLNDVNSFKPVLKFQRSGNILKIYSIYFKDGEIFSFWAINFKSFDEYRDSLYESSDLFEWNKYSNICTYKVNKKTFIAVYIDNQN